MEADSPGADLYDPDTFAGVEGREDLFSDRACRAFTDSDGVRLGPGGVAGCLRVVGDGLHGFVCTLAASESTLRVRLTTSVASAYLAFGDSTVGWSSWIATPEFLVAERLAGFVLRALEAFTGALTRTRDSGVELAGLSSVWSDVVVDVDADPSLRAVLIASTTAAAAAIDPTAPLQ